MMNPFMSYTQSFNESMTKDDREDAERRMAYVKPVTAGIATPTAIQAAQNGAMTKDDREDAERRMAMQAASTPRQIVPSAQLSTAAPEQQYPLPMSVTSKPVSSGIATPTAIQAAQSGAMTKDEREYAEKLIAYAKVVQSGMTKDDREDAERRMAYVKPVTAGIASPAAIQATQRGAMTKDEREALEGQSGEAIQETQDAIAAAFKALSVSKSQGTVNVNAFNNARIELKNAKDALAVAQSRATPGEQVLMSQLQEQVDTIQGEVDIQLRYLQAAQAAQTPSGSYGGPSGSGYTEPPPTKPVTSGIVSKTVIDAQKGGYAGPSGSGYTEPSGTSYPGPSGSGYSGPSGSNYPGPSGSNYPGPSGGGGGGSGGGYIPKKVMVLEPSKPYGGPSGSLPADTAAGTDWVKLGLQIGAAYLLFT